MAALFLKSLRFPKDSMTTYRPIRPNTPDSASIERGHHSTVSGISTDNHNFDEKKPSASSTFKTARINPRVISDATIGLSDGLTVPFALTAGLSALGSTHIVVYGGLAELIAGGISMGLGGYLGAKSEAEAYQVALSDTKAIVREDPCKSADLVKGCFDAYGLSDEVLSSVVRELLGNGEERTVEFLMSFQHQLAESDFAPERAYISGLTIALGYVFGGAIALLPYLFCESIGNGFLWSVVVMAMALFGFGCAKTALVGEGDHWKCVSNGVQMLILGGVAAGAAMACVKALG